MAKKRQKTVDDIPEIRSHRFQTIVISNGEKLSWFTLVDTGTARVFGDKLGSYLKASAITNIKRYKQLSVEGAEINIREWCDYMQGDITYGKELVFDN